MYSNPNQLRFQKSVALIKPIRLSFKQEGAKYFFFLDFSCVWSSSLILKAEKDWGELNM